MINIMVVSYVAHGLLPSNLGQEQACAFILQRVDVVDKDRKKTGETRYERLPMVFFADTSVDACVKAQRFWADETAKAAAKIERGKALAAKNKRSAA